MEASDREFGFECLQHYNDWMVEEWCGAAPGRYIPLMLIPMWDPQLAAKEMERMAAKGVTTFAFSENPEPWGCRRFTTRTATGIRSWRRPTNSGWSRACTSAPRRRAQDLQRRAVHGQPHLGCLRTSGTMLSWLFSGLFQRFPNLKIALSEGEIGWMPYFLERAEQVLDKQRYWVKRGHDVHGPRG